MTSPTGVAGSSLSQARKWVILAVVSLGTVIVFLDNTVVNTAIPSISVDLEASISNLQWVIDAYTLALAGLLLIGGAVGDRFGRKRFMIVGLVIFGVGAIGGALSSDINTLIAMRAVQGAGAAFILPATLSIITDVFDRGERAKAIGIWSGVGALGIGLGPVVGGALVDGFGWASVFWMHLPVIALTLAGLLFVPESKDTRERSLDLPGAALGTAAVSVLVFGLIRAGEVGWLSGQTIAFGVVAGLLVTLFVVYESRVKEPMLPMPFFREKDFSGAVLVIGLIMFGMLVSFFFLTQFFQIVQGRSAFEAGLLIVPTALAMMVSAPVAGILVKSIGPRILVLASAAAVTTCLVMLTQIEVDSSSLFIVAALAVFGLGAGLGLAPLTDTVMAAVPVGDAGIASAVNDVSRELGAALGIATIGSVVNALYRSSIGDTLPAGLPAEAVAFVEQGVGAAGIAAGQLPSEVGQALVSAANTAFVDAMTTGFAVSAAFVALTAIVAITMIPKRMRIVQADDHGGAADRLSQGVGEAESVGV